MACKTVNFDCCIGVTTLAELSLSIDWNVLPFIILNSVAFDTAGQRVFLGPNPEMYRIVPLVHQKPEMIATHDVIRLHARRSLAPRILGLRSISLQDSGPEKNEHQGEKQVAGQMRHGSIRACLTRPFPYRYSRSDKLRHRYDNRYSDHSRYPRIGQWWTVPSLLETLHPVDNR